MYSFVSKFIGLVEYQTAQTIYEQVMFRNREGVYYLREKFNLKMLAVCTTIKVNAFQLAV